MDFITHALVPPSPSPTPTLSQLPSDSWTPPSGYELPTHHGASGLLVLIATVCVVGVIAAAIRAIVAHRRDVQEPTTATPAARIDAVARELGTVYRAGHVAPLRPAYPEVFGNQHNYAAQRKAAETYGRHAGTNTGTFTAVKHKMDL